MSAVSQLKRLAGDSLIYGISGTIARSLTVFLVPIYTRLFEPAEYAIIGLTTSFFALIAILALVGLDSSVARWYYDSDDEIDRQNTINTFLWSIVASGVAFGVLTYVASDSIADKIFGSPTAGHVVRIASVNLPLSIFTAFTWNVLRLQRRSVATAAFTVATSGVTIGLTIMFVVALKLGIPGIFYAQIVASAVALLWSVILFHRILSIPRIDTSRLRDMLRFSLPLVPGSVAFWIVNLSGAYFVRASLDMHEAGLYQVGATVATGMTLLTGAFQMAWGPFAYSIHKETNADQVYSLTLTGYVIVVGGAAMALTLFSREILLIFTTGEYASSFWVTGILAFNFLIVGITYIASIGPGIAKNNYAFGVSMLASAGLLVVLNLILVPRIGKEGAALATLASQALVPVAVFVHGQRIHPIPYSFRRVGGALALGIAISFLVLYITSGMLGWLLPGAIKMATLLGYGALVLILFGAETRRGIEVFRPLLKRGGE